MKQVLWFIAIWVGSVTALGLVGLIVRNILALN
ncbi:DUF2474 family protein [Roseovarius sp. M141]|nr:DUF2474 family protein [Roseovarius sp. M141]